MYNNIKQIVQLKLENNKFDEMITRENDKAILEEEQSFFYIFLLVVIICDTTWDEIIIKNLCL